MDGDGGDVQLAAKGAAVEGFDVLKLMDVLDALRIDLPIGEGVKHERIVRVRTVRKMDGARCGHVFSPRLFRACCSALVMSSWCRMYSSRFLGSSVLCAASNLRSYEWSAAVSPASVARRASRMSPSRWFGFSRNMLSACALASGSAPATSPIRPMS